MNSGSVAGKILHTTRQSSSGE